jgi:hypothetical protein
MTATVANGISTQVKRVKQSALGSPGSTGSKLMRRTQLTLNKQSSTYASQEISSDQMGNADQEGPYSVAGQFNGEVSAGTYDKEWAALLRADFATPFTAITGASLTIAGAGPTYTVTRATGSFLTDGVKKAHVVRLSVGTLNAANINKNLIVVGVTATVLTVVPFNGVALVAEGPITGCTVTGIGKESHTPTTGHTNDYLTYEKWYADISRSHLFSDVKPSKGSVTIPATGIPTVSFDMVGLGRSPTGSEVCTSPTAETTSDVLESVRGLMIVNGTVTPLTNCQFAVDGATTPGDPEIGSATLSDLQRGMVKGSGSFSAKFTDDTLATLRDNQTQVVLIFGAAEDTTANSDFVVWSFPGAKIHTDDADDGAKQIVRNYNWTAGKDRTGGAALATHYTVCMCQDSLAA